MRRWNKIVLLLVLALLLSGCADRMFSDKTIIEWSRGHRVGNATQSEPVAMQITPDGSRVVLAWVSESADEKAVLHLAILDGQGVAVVDKDLPLDLVEPTAPRLALRDGGQLELAWLDKREHIEQLYRVSLTGDGQLATEPTILSAEGFRVHGYELTALPSGDALIVWSNRSGLRSAIVGNGAEIRASEIFEAPGATGLDIQVDADGLPHVSWQQSFHRSERRLYYSSLDLASLTFEWPVYLSTQVLKAGSTLGGSAEELLGPVMALGKDRIIVSWAIGETRGNSHSVSFLGFVPGEQKELSPQRVAVPGLYQPAYEEASGNLPYVQLASGLELGQTRGAASLHTAPSTLEGQVEQIPLAVSLWIRTSWGPQLQPAMVTLKDAKVEGFQVLSWTRYPSLHPTLSTDSAGNLYYAWIDATGSAFPVYVASTAPGMKAAWDNLSSDDLVVALERLFGRMLSAVGVIFVGLSWIILPGFLLLLILFVLKEDSLLTARGRWALIVLVFAYWTGKYLFTPDILTALPKMSDLPVIFPLLTVLAPETFAFLPNQLHLPAFIAPLVPFLLPTMILAVCLIIVRVLYLLPSKRPSLVPAFLILAVVDVFLTLQIYALTYHNPVKF